MKKRRPFSKTKIQLMIERRRANVISQGRIALEMGRTRETVSRYESKRELCKPTVWFRYETALNTLEKLVRTG